MRTQVQPLRLARPAALCQHPGARDRHPPCQCSLFLHPSTHRQISLVCAACLKTDEPEKCTHKLAEVWNHESLGKASTAFTHPFALPPRRCPDGCRQTKWRLSRAFSQVRILALMLVPRLRACKCTKLTCLPSVAQMIRPCCFGSRWVWPPTAPTRPIPRTSSTPSSTGRASATFRATSTLSTTRTRTTSWWRSTRRGAAPRSLPSARRFSCQMGRWSSWAWTCFAQRSVTVLRF